MKRAYELAISAGKKGHDIFGAILDYENEKIVTLDKLTQEWWL